MKFDRDFLLSLDYLAEGNCNIVLQKDEHVIRIRKIQDEDFSNLDQMIFYKLFQCIFNSNSLCEMELIECDAKVINEILNKIEHKRPSLRRTKMVDPSNTCVTRMPNLVEMKGFENCVSVHFKPKFGSIAITGYEKFESSCQTCRFCLMQNHKCKTTVWSNKSKYCPLKLFSGNEIIMKSALDAIFDEPQNNLHIFEAGCKKNVTKTIKRDLYQDIIIQALLHEHTTDEKAINNFKDHFDFSKCPRDFNEKCSFGNFDESLRKKLPQKSALAAILRVQKLTSDNYITLKDSVLRVKEYLKENSLTYNQLINRIVMDDKTISQEILQLVNKLIAFQLGLTAKDCEIMINFAQLDNKFCVKEFDKDFFIVESSVNHKSYVVRIKVVDIDAKNVFNIDKRIEKEMEILNVRSL